MAVNFKELDVGRFVKVADANRGVLQARKGTNGAITFYWRWRHQGKDGRIEIGLYDAKIPPLKAEPINARYNVLTATLAANKLADEHMQSIKDGNAGIVAVQQERRIQREAESRRKELETIAQTQKLEFQNQWTLGRLLDLYCEHLLAKGKTSHREAANLFQNHIKAPYANLCALPARDLCTDDVVEMMRRLNELGKERTANKLRSYLRSAYSVARSAKTNAAINRHFNRFAIVANPASDTVPNSTANRTDKNPLSLEEMRTYWQLIQKCKDTKGALLRLHLLTGAQRPAQLVRLQQKDVQDEALILWDTKGKRVAPRKHQVPLLEAVHQDLAHFEGNLPHLISTNKGRTTIGSSTVTHWAADVVGDAIVNFSIKRVRSGVETLLSKRGVSLEVRGELQSHGLGGVQKRSYDGNDFLEEKRTALNTLYATLNETSAKVVHIKRKQA